MSDLKRQFGQSVIRYRKALGMTQSEFAEALGVVLQTIGHIERGIHGPRLELLEKMCGVLEVHPKQLFDFDNE